MTTPDDPFRAPGASAPAPEVPRASGRAIWMGAAAFLVYQFPAGAIGNLPADRVAWALPAWLFLLAAGAFAWGRTFRVRGLGHPADLSLALRLVLAFHALTKGLPILVATFAPGDDPRVPLLVLAEWLAASALGLGAGLLVAAPAPPPPPEAPPDEDEVDVFAPLPDDERQ